MMLHSRILSLIIAFALVYEANGQVTVSSLIINTAYDPITATAIASGSNGGTPVRDPHWIVSSISPDIVNAIAATPTPPGLMAVAPGANANVIQNAGPWVSSPFGNPSGWISCLNSNTYNDLMTGSTNYLVVMGRPFKMCSDDSIKLSFSAAADNAITGADIDGTPLIFTSSTFTSYTSFTRTVFLTAGIHTLRLYVNNMNIPVGSPNPSNPMGFNLYGTVASASGKKSLLSESNFSRPKRDSICSGEALTLQTNLDSNFFSWTVLPGGSAIGSLSCTTCINPIANPTQTTEYITVSTAGAFCNDTTIITVFAMPVVDLGPDTSVCTNNLQLQSANTYASPVYLWSTGATTPTYIATNTGDYWLRVTENGCEAADTIHVAIGSAINVNLGNDTGICDTDMPVILSSSQPAGTQYLWSNGKNTTSIKAIQAGTYWLKVTLGNCEGSDTILVKITPAPVVHIGNDTLICEGNLVTIGDTINNAAYLWSTGSTQPSITVTTSGNYWRTLDIEGCKVSDTVQVVVAPVPAPDLGPDSDICEDQEIVLHANNESGTYHWSTGDTTPSLTVSEPGVYWVAITSAYGCQGEDTVSLSYYPFPTIILDGDTTVCEETPLILKPVHAINVDEVRWSTGSSDQQISVTAGGVYTVQATNKCGSANDTINITQIFCDIWLPNAFTPDGDGVNDVFRVVGNIGRLESFSLSIFNRWGERLFNTSDRYSGWDGRHKGGNAGTGTYVYMLEYTLNNKPTIQKGNFHLLR